MEGSGDQWLHLVALLAGSCLSLAEGGEVARLRGGGGGTGPGTAGGHLDMGLHYSTVQYSTVLLLRTWTQGGTEARSPAWRW